MVTMKINIHGARELEKNLGNPDAVRLPLRRFYLRGRDHLVPRIKRRIRTGPARAGHSPGAGRKSVESKLDDARIPRFIKIFSSTYYIRIYEYGAPGHNQKARKPFRGELKRNKKIIFRFAAEAGREMARIIAKGR